MRLAFEPTSDHPAVQAVTYGPVVLSGDLYHYPEERKLKKVPTTEYNAKQTVESRTAIENFLKKSKAQLWIQHDLIANAKLKKSPQYYD